MPLAISFELSDRDLEHFNAAIKAARDSAGNKPAEEIVAAAGKLLEDANKVDLPDFIATRLDHLDALIAMVRDEGWSLNDADRQHVLSALVYFADPADITTLPKALRSRIETELPTASFICEATVRIQISS